MVSTNPSPCVHTDILYVQRFYDVLSIN